jgi:hypothetical protein
VDERLQGRIAEVDRNQAPLVIFLPAPGDEILEAGIVGPTAALAEIPFSVVKEWLIRCSEKLCVEVVEGLIDGLVRAAAEEDRHSDLAAFELALVEEPCSGKSERRYGNGSFFGG